MPKGIPRRVQRWYVDSWSHAILINAFVTCGDGDGALKALGAMRRAGHRPVSCRTRQHRRPHAHGDLVQARTLLAEMEADFAGARKDGGGGGSDDDDDDDDFVARDEARGDRRRRLRARPSATTTGSRTCGRPTRFFAAAWSLDVLMMP